MVVPAGCPHHHACSVRQASPHIVNSRFRRREVDHRIKSREKRSRQRHRIAVFFLAHHANAVSVLTRYVGDDAARLAAPQHQEQHRLPHFVAAVALLRASTSKISGSGLSKNSACSERTASSASSSSIMKLMLISDAPCEIMRTLMWRMALKSRAAIPFCPRIFSPTMQTSALRPSYFTSANLLRSAAISGSFSLESTVSETLTSEVETISTAHLCLSKTSKMARI